MFYSLVRHISPVFSRLLRTRDCKLGFLLVVAGVVCFVALHQVEPGLVNKNSRLIFSLQATLLLGTGYLILRFAKVPLFSKIGKMIIVTAIFALWMTLIGLPEFRYFLHSHGMAGLENTLLELFPIYVLAWIGVLILVLFSRDKGRYVLGNSRSAQVTNQSRRPAIIAFSACICRSNSVESGV